MLVYSKIRTLAGMGFPTRFMPAPEGGFAVTFRDVPEAIIQGDSREEAMAMAGDALVSAMDFYSETGRAVPVPCEALPGEVLVELLNLA